MVSKASMLWLLVKQGDRGGCGELLTWLMCLSKHGGCAQAIYSSMEQ